MDGFTAVLTYSLANSMITVLQLTQSEGSTLTQPKHVARDPAVKPRDDKTLVIANDSQLLYNRTMIKACELSPGYIVKISGFYPGNLAYRQKLLAMGLTPETEFEVIRYAPLGDPIEIRVRDFYLTLRRDEMALLQLERVT